MSKTDFYKNTLTGADSKTMYQTLNALLNKSASILPSTSSNGTLSNNFAKYFSEKVDKIRSELDSCVSSVNTCTYDNDNKCDNVCTNNSNVQYADLCNNDDGVTYI